MAHRGVVLHDPVHSGRVLVDDEATTDRVVGALTQDSSSWTERPEDHPVGVGGQAPATVHGDVVLSREVDDTTALQHEATGCRRLGNLLIRRIRVDGLRSVALEAEDDRLVRAVTVAGGAERAEQLCLEAFYLREQTSLRQSVGEEAGGAHRTDRVRGRRPDADREHVEGTEGHQDGPAVGGASGDGSASSVIGEPPTP